MSLRRLRVGEWITCVGAVGLLVVLFLDWFALDTGGVVPVFGNTVFSLGQSGWSSLGWALDVLLAVAIAAGLAIVLTTALRQTPAWSVGAGVLAVPVGAIAFLVLLVRVCVFQPGLAGGFPDDEVAVQGAAYVGLVFCALIPVGAWRVLADERTGAPESAYTPPPARPVPGT